LYDGKSGTPRRYWNLAAEVERAQVSPNPQQREDMLLTLCTEAVDLHLRSDVPVGVALSGGLDSATLLVLLHKTHPNPTHVEAFSYDIADAAYSERAYVEKMAKLTGRRAHFVEVSARTFADTAERICVSQEEPHAGHLSRPMPCVLSWPGSWFYCDNGRQRSG
jgi:asparagine synthase (glutamine-hydrolysing)